MNVIEQRNYIANKLRINKQKLAQSILRAETDLTTQNTVKFTLQRNQKTSPNGTEILLQQNDAFVITHLQLLLYKVAAGSPSDAQRGVADLYNYVNKSVFDGSNDANLQALFNAYFQLSVNRTEYLTAFPSLYFERVPDTQKGTTTTAYVNASNANATTTIARDAKPNGFYGAFPTDLIVINGFESVEAQLVLPATVNMQESNETNTAVLLAHGYLAKGTAIKNLG